MSSFFSKVGSIFSKLFGAAPSALQTASAVIKFVGPLLSSILRLVGGEALAAEVQNIVAEIQTDLVTAANLISQAHGAPSASAYDQVATILSSVNNNLAALLAAGHIKNADTVNKVEAVVNTITGEIGAVIGLLQPPPAQASTFSKVSSASGANAGGVPIPQ